MTRRLCLLLMALACLSLGALSVQAEDNPFIVTVRVPSAFARAVPDIHADEVASVFEHDRLLVVSRNADGTWFEVRRPGRLTNLGWVFNEVLNWEFNPEELPLGDSVTGVIGPNPIPQGASFAVFLLQGPAMREGPTRRDRRIMAVPPLVTVPVLGRNQDGSWLYINYLGYQGWIISFTARVPPGVLNVPQAPNLPPLETPLVVLIPVELQQGQIDRLREFIHPRRDLARELEVFWWRVFRGEIMPCDAPPEIANYPYSDADVRELPELGRYVPRLVTAVQKLNDARAPLLACGVVSPQAVGDARDSAINARITFDAVLQALDDLERNVVQARR